MEENNIIIFGDSTGRLLIGRKINENDELIVVSNPHIIEADVSTGPDGKPRQGLKYIPNSYLELFEIGSENVWTFPKSTHIFNNNKLSKEAIEHFEQLLEAYERIRVKQSAQVGSNDEIQLVD